ncbi:hypothetical protein ASD65_08650 [Microbacterium sp. Root61]|nr:hypothetical protein ASD65_08650 [Microbacterium sp. Root61]
MPGSVVVVGESLVDVVVDVDRTERRMPGGSPMNVAVGLARLGMPTTLLTTFGDDDDGRFIAGHLSSAGVSVAGGSMTPGTRTSTARARLARDGSASYEFDLRWDIPPGRGLPAEAVALHTGSLATVIAPGAGRVLELFEQAGSGVLRSFDPNARPAITPDRATALESVERFGRHADILKLSDEDAAWLLPGADHRDVADWALGLGVGLFAMTRGADGCVLTTARHRVEQPGIRTRVVDTIGAGDAFTSALIAGATRWGLAQSLAAGALEADEAEALATLAQRAASATVARAGAQPPTWAEVVDQGSGSDADVGHRASSMS